MRLPITLLMLLSSAAASAAPPRQTESDGYTRYELLAPGRPNSGSYMKSAQPRLVQ